MKQKAERVRNTYCRKKNEERAAKQFSGIFFAQFFGRNKTYTHAHIHPHTHTPAHTDTHPHTPAHPLTQIHNPPPHTHTVYV